MSRPALLDGAYLIDLERETAAGIHSAPASCVTTSWRERRVARGHAESLDADIVGAVRTAFERLGARYLRFR